PIEIDYKPSQIFMEARPWFVAVDPSSGTITIDTKGSTTSATTGGGHTVTLTPFTVANNNNRLLVVIISTLASRTTSSVTWNAVAMTKQSSLQNTGEASIWTLVAPATGTNNLIITTSANTNIVVGWYSLYGVSQTTPVGAKATPTSGTNGNPSI